MKKRVITALLSIIVAAGSSFTVYAADSTLIDIINKEHQEIVKPDVDFDEYITQASSDNFDITNYMMDMSKGINANLDTLVTLEQAEEDLDILFRSLETTYGPYYYFGGDKAFDAAKEKIIADFKDSENKSASVLAKLILKHLSFIQDGHFNIAGRSLHNSVIPYIYKDIAFQKTDSGYRALDTKQKVESVDGYKNLDELFKRSLSENGEIVYYPVILKEFVKNSDNETEDLKVNFTNGTSKVLKGFEYKSYYDRTSNPVELHYNQGIPVLFVRNMGFDEAKGDEIGKEFLKYAEILKNEPVAIIDLRSNGGGNSVLAFKWFEEYTGEPVTTNYSSIQYWSEQDMLDYAENKDNMYYMSYETMTDVAGYEPISESYCKTNAQPDTFAENKNLIIILTGKNTASAAETFVDIAHNVSNTIVIGENTYGVLISNAYTVIQLPNSTIPVQLGSDLSMFPENDYFNEFVGIKPDIWTNGENAEELAVKLIKNITK